MPKQSNKVKTETRTKSAGQEKKGQTEAGLEKPTNLVLSFPRETIDDATLHKLKIMAANREQLLKHVLGAESLEIETTKDKVSFPWFNVPDGSELAKIYMDFITAMINRAKQKTHIIPRDNSKPYENEKFAFRIFMIDLGLKGPKYAELRHELMKNLSGNSSFRYGDSRKKKVEETVAKTKGEAIPDKLKKAINEPVVIPEIPENYDEECPF